MKKNQHLDSRKDEIINPYKMTADEMRTVLTKCNQVNLTPVRDEKSDKLHALKKAGFDALVPCRTKDEVFDKLMRYKFDEKMAATIYQDMDASLKSDAKTMLFLVSKDELAFLHVAPEIRTPSFIADAIKENHDVYRLLSDAEKKDPFIVKAYVEGVLNSIGRNDDGNRYMAINNNDIPYLVAAYRLHEGCPKNEFYSPQNYKMVFERAIHKMQQFDYGSEDFHDQGRASGIESSYLAVARYMYRDNHATFDEIEANVIRENADVVQQTIENELAHNQYGSPLAELAQERCPELSFKTQTAGKAEIEDKEPEIEIDR